MRILFYFFFSAVVENLQIKDGGPYRETIPWSNISLNRQHDLENIDKRRVIIAFNYGLAD